MRHNVIKVVTGNEPIIIKISLHEHFFDFLISQIFSQILSYFFQFKNSDFSLIFNQFITALLISNDEKTLSIYCLVSLSEILAVANFKNYGKSIPPDWSASSSAKIWYTNLFWPPKPKLMKAYLSSWGSTVPDPSSSKISNAIFISLTS